MQFDAVGRHACFSVQEIKHPDAGYLHGHVRKFEARGGREHRIELQARVDDARGEWTAGTDAAGIRNLANDRIAGGILQNDVIIRIVFKLVFEQVRVDGPNTGFDWRDAII